MVGKNNLLSQGAEALIMLNDKSKPASVIKLRTKKSYRISQIDDRIRRLRTRSESRLLLRASKVISVPKVLSTDELNNELIIEYVKGKRLSEHLDSINNADDVCFVIGCSVAKLHDSDIVHGDLTTSNIILENKSNKVFFIDFGLSFFSRKVEDKAVDIHLFKQALEAKHFKHYDSFLSSFIKGYKKSVNYEAVFDRLKKVESRGRYKH